MSVTIEKNDNLISAKVWGRTYAADQTHSVLSSIISQNEELLAAPISLYLECDGKKSSFSDAITLTMQSENDKKTFLRTFESNVAIVNISESFEEDGFGIINLSLMPKGLSIAQVFGLEDESDAVFAPNKFYMEIRIKQKFSKYYQVYPVCNLFGSDEIVDDSKLPIPGALTFAGFVPSNGFYTTFKEQIYLSGDTAGLGLVFENDRTWCTEDKNRVIEAERCENGDALLRIHFLDKLPKVWQIEKGSDRQPVYLPPISFEFGIMATPVKKFPNHSFYERNLHIDCFKKIAENYDDFLASDVSDGSGENGYDRLKRLGVEVLYLHEKWNDIQNSPFLTEETMQRIKTIVSECHKREIKVIPYFGYELSTLSPIFAKYGDKFARKLTGDYYSGHWYRYPYQRDLPICIKNDWADILFEGLCKVYDELQFDGLYFDGLYRPMPCQNTEHGCGYIDDDGILHTTYAVWAGRELAKKIYKFVKSRGGTINIHALNSCPLAELNYCDSAWEGEIFQSLLMKGQIDELPEGIMRAQFTGRDTGVPVYSLCYSNPPVWTFRNAASVALIHGSIPKPVDIGEPLEDMSKIWDAFDSFPLDDAEWKPYWNKSTKISCDCEDIKISVWEAENKYLCVCASTTRNFEKAVTITCDLPILKDVMDNTILSQNGTFERKFIGFDYIMFTADKNV